MFKLLIGSFIFLIKLINFDLCYAVIHYRSQDTFVCNGKEKLNQPLIIVWSNQLYFFFESHLIKVNDFKLFFIPAKDPNELDKIYYFMKDSQFSNHEWTDFEKKQATIYSYKDKLLGIVEVQKKSKKIDVYAIIKNYNITTRASFLPIGFSSKYVLGPSEEELETNEDLAFFTKDTRDMNLVNYAIVRKDEITEKQFEITYRDDKYSLNNKKIVYTLYNTNPKDDNSYEFKGITISYLVKSAVLINYLNNPDIYLIGIDDQNVLHIEHIYLNESKFIFKSKNSIDMSIEEFFMCPPNRYRNARTFKGIYYSMDKNFFVLFFHNRYVIIYQDLVSKQFKINERGKQFISSRVKSIPEINNSIFERMYIKYVKNLNSNSFLSFNLNETYELNIKTINESFHKIDLNKINKYAHLCEKQILTIKGHSFCFDEKKYYFASRDDFDSFSGDLTKKREIYDLFNAQSEQGDIFSRNEHVHLIFNWRLPNTNDDGDNEDHPIFIVLLTNNYQYLIKRDILDIKELKRDVNDIEDYELIIKSHKSEDYIRLPNCLFHLDKYCKTVAINNRTLFKTPSDNQKETKSNFMFYLILFIIFLIASLTLLFKHDEIDKYNIFKRRDSF